MGSARWRAVVSLEVKQTEGRRGRRLSRARPRRPDWGCEIGSSSPAKRRGAGRGKGGSRVTGPVSSLTPLERDDGDPNRACARSRLTPNGPNEAYFAAETVCVA